MTPKTPAWHISILEEHLEELQMLWESRQASVRDLEYDAADLRELDERIEAHTDGLILGDQHAQSMLEEALAGGDSLVVFSGAYVLLRRNDEASANRVMEALESAEEEEQIKGLTDALCFASISLVSQRLKTLLASSDANLAVSAATALAFHGQLPKNSPELVELLRADDPAVRAATWNVIALLGG